MDRFPNLSPAYRWGSIVTILVIAVLAWHFLTRQVSSTSDAPQGISHVRVASIAGLSSDLGPLPVTGKVTSRSQATVLSQSAGQIVSLRHQIGDRVSAGEVIATFDSASQQAAVVQAQGAYDAAKAALEKASGTTAQNSSLTSSQAAQSATSAFTSLITSLQSTYAALDGAVHTSADTMFSNPRSSLVSFTPSVPDSQLVITIRNERQQLELLLDDAQSLVASAATDNADTVSDAMVAHARSVVQFLDHVINAANIAQPNQAASASSIATYQTTMSTARTTVVAAISSLTTAKASFDSANTSAQTAANSATTASGSDIASAKASLMSAQGGLDAARANLEKTVIRSPISGTIVSLSLHKGDYVPVYSQVAQVSNPNALEVDAYVTPDDAKTLAPGNKALIDGSTKGVITFIAPAIDPTTNKIEVTIGITGDQSALSSGDTESVTLDRSVSENTIAKKTPEQIVIPIVAAKITPQGPVIFTVGTSSALVAHSITLGTILGDRVVVASGVTPDMYIVSDARGLSDGETVVIDQ